MAVIITGNNTPTAGGITYGDGTTYANTAAGTSGQPVVSGGAGAPAFRPYTLPAADGSANQLLQTNGSGALSFATVSAGFTLGTPTATTSGTSIDFLSIPAGVKQIVISFNGVSTNGTSEKSIQLGDAGGIETSGYNCTSMRLEGAGISPTSSTGGFEINSVLIGDTIIGSVILTLENSSTNAWAITGVLGHTSASQFTLAGRKSLSAVLDRVRLTTAGGVNTFDAGEINIAYI